MKLAASRPSLLSSVCGLIQQTLSSGPDSVVPKWCSRGFPSFRELGAFIFLITFRAYQSISSYRQGRRHCASYDSSFISTSLPKGPCPTGGTESSPSSTVEKAPSLAPSWNRATAAPAPTTSLPARAPSRVPWGKGPRAPTVLRTTAHAAGAATQAMCWPRACAGPRWPSPWRTFWGWRQTCRTWS